MKVGHVRTSKKDQNPELQRRNLLTFGCEKVFKEQISSRKEDRPELRATMDYCREGDELVVWKLDRFGRSLRELIDPVNGLRERTMAGLEAARARGRRGGRKPAMDERKIALASKLMRDRETPIAEVCEAVGVLKATIYRYLEPDGTPRRSAS